MVTPAELTIEFLQEEIRELKSQLEIQEQVSLRLQDMLKAFEKESEFHKDLLKNQETALERIIGAAGRPDAAEGCRIIIKLAKSALGIP